MERALRQTVVIGPEGRFEGKAPGFPMGATAEIIVLPLEADWEAEEREAERQEWLRKAWAISDRATFDDAEVWDVDRINAEVQARRHGDRERP